LVLTTPANIRYFAGVAVEAYERFAALVICGARKALVLPELDRGRAAAEAYYYKDGEDPAEALRRAAEGCEGPVKIDGGTTARALEVIRRALGPSYEIADEEIYALRAVKRAEEVERIAAAARAIKEVVEEAAASLEPGASERQVAARIFLALADRGLEPGPILVQFGENTALPHQGPTGRRLREGDAVVIDVTAAYEGYYGDITRSFAFRGGPRGYGDVHEAVAEAQRAAIAAARPGARAGDVDEAARAALRARGLGQYFTHRTGHGLGLEFHERPNIAPNSAEVLKPGNVFTVEPGVYLPGKFGVRIEDDVVVAESGAEVL
jgi:Xaa-Pro dipeptidase